MSTRLFIYKWIKWLCFLCSTIYLFGFIYGLFINNISAASSLLPFALIFFFAGICWHLYIKTLE